jgi:hypothetical protein
MLAAQFNGASRSDGGEHKEQMLKASTSSGCLLTPILAAIDKHYPALTTSASNSSSCSSAQAVTGAAPPLWRASSSRPAGVPKKKKWRRMPLPLAPEGSAKEPAESPSAMMPQESAWQHETAAAVVAQQTTANRLPWVSKEAEAEPQPESINTATDVAAVDGSNVGVAAGSAASVRTTAADEVVDRSMAVSPTSTACDVASASGDMMQCDDTESTVQLCNARNFWPDSDASSGASTVGYTSQHSSSTSSSSSSSSSNGSYATQQNVSVTAVQTQSSSSTLPAYAAQYNDYLNQLMKFKVEGHFEESFRQQQAAALAQRWALDAAVSLQLKLPVLQYWCTAGHISEDVRRALAEQAWAAHIETATVELKRKRL